jgi:hypothetical protein
MSPQVARSAVGQGKMSPRLHAAIFTSTDPTARTTLLVAGTLADVQANTPPGGCWRQVPAGVHRAADVPTLGALPTPVIVAAVPAPTKSGAATPGTTDATPR